MYIRKETTIPAFPQNFLSIFVMMGSITPPPTNYSVPLSKSYPHALHGRSSRYLSPLLDNPSFLMPRRPCAGQICLSLCLAGRAPDRSAFPYASPAVRRTDLPFLMPRRLCRTDLSSLHSHFLLIKMTAAATMLLHPVECLIRFLIKIFIIALLRKGHAHTQRYSGHSCNFLLQLCIEVSDPA